MYESIISNFKTLYYATSNGDMVYINPNVYIDGDGIQFIYTMNSTHDCNLSTSKKDNQFLCDAVDNYDKYEKYIKKINDRFNTTLDKENLVVSINFKRNEMTLTDAVMKLTQVVYLYSSISLLSKK